jgi:hypothetical protein
MWKNLRMLTPQAPVRAAAGPLSAAGQCLQVASIREVIPGCSLCSRCSQRRADPEAQVALLCLQSISFRPPPAAVQIMAVARMGAL